MGGRGASFKGSGDNGHKYGTEFQTVFQAGNVKFVRRIQNSTAQYPLESKIPGRIYVTVERETNGIESPKFITYIGSSKRYKGIDLWHPHEGANPHVHEGYYHDEQGTRLKLSPKERRQLGEYMQLWKNYLRSGRSGHSPKK